jgi:hypothetical protein
VPTGMNGHGRWAFVKFTGIYPIESDFVAKM